MLKYQGHIFDGGEALNLHRSNSTRETVDPTGTNKLRSAFNSQVAIKWRGARLSRKVAWIRIFADDHPPPMANPSSEIQNGATKVQSFQRCLILIDSQVESARSCANTSDARMTLVKSSLRASSVVTSPRSPDRGATSSFKSQRQSYAASLKRQVRRQRGLFRSDYSTASSRRELRGTCRRQSTR